MKKNEGITGLDIAGFAIVVLILFNCSFVLSSGCHEPVKAEESFVEFEMPVAGEAAFESIAPVAGAGRYVNP